MLALVCQVAWLYVVVIIVRILLSWFPLAPGGLAARVNDLLVAVTEPVLGPVRRVLPRLGPLDLSPIVVIIGIQVLMALVGC